MLQRTKEKVDWSISRRFDEVQSSDATKARMIEKSLVSTQQRMLNIAKPLTFLWGAISSDEDLANSDLKPAIDAALQL